MGTQNLADLKFGHYMERREESRSLAVLGMIISCLWEATGARRTVRADMGRGRAAPLRGEPKSWHKASATQSKNTGRSACATGLEILGLMEEGFLASLGTTGAFVG